jgi:pimeloyl-ACP methyl ester carboxylesterase
MRGNGASTGFDETHSFRQSARDMFALLDHLSIDKVKAIGLNLPLTRSVGMTLARRFNAGIVMRPTQGIVA